MSIDKIGYKETSFPPIIEQSALQNQFVEADILASDKNVYLLNTQRRLGCDAVLLLTVEKNGTVHSIVTHYDPEHVIDHLKVIATKTVEHPLGKRYAVLVTRGGHADKWRLQIEGALEKYTGGKVDTVDLSNLNETHIPEIANPATRLNYQLSFIRGYGGDPNKLRVYVPATTFDKFI